MKVEKSLRKVALLTALVGASACRPNEPANDPKTPPNSPFPEIERPSDPKPSGAPSVDGGAAVERGEDDHAVTLMRSSSEAPLTSTFVTCANPAEMRGSLGWRAVCVSDSAGRGHRPLKDGDE